MIREGFNFVGIEREAEYVEIARKRISHEASKGTNLLGGRAMTAPDAANTPPNRRYVTYPSGRSADDTAGHHELLSPFVDDRSPSTSNVSHSQQPA